MARQRIKPRRRIDQATEDELRRRQANLTALTQHPSWVDLEAEVDRKAAHMEKVVLAKVFGRGPSAPIDELELQWMRGFVAGMRWFSAVPAQAESSLLRYLEQQGISTEGVEA